MTKQDVFELLAEAVSNGEAKSVTHTVRNGVGTVQVKVAPSIMLYLNEDDTILVRVFGKKEDFPFTYAQLKEQTDEAKEAKRREQLAKYKEQLDILQGKIEELEPAEKPKPKKKEAEPEPEPKPAKRESTMARLFKRFA